MWSAMRSSGSRHSDLRAAGGRGTGRSTLLLAVAFVLCGAAFDSPSLYVPGVALAGLVAGARLWVELAARETDLTQLPGPRSIVEGQPYSLRVLVGGHRVPLPGGRLWHPQADGPTPVGRRFSGEARLELRSLRRGRRRLEPATLLLSDPLRLRTAEIRDEADEHVLVLPRIEPVLKAGANGGGVGQGALSGPEGGGGAGLEPPAVDFEIDGFRPYRHGSPASRIHWPTVARTGQVVEHRLLAGAGSAPLVVLDASDPPDEDSLDSAVRAATSLCVHLTRSGGCALLLPGSRRPLEIDARLRGWPQIHARLALVEAGGGPPSIRRTSHAATIFWVGAGSSVPGAARGLGVRGCYVVTPLPIPGLASTFTVAGCSGQRLRPAPTARRAPGARAAA